MENNIISLYKEILKNQFEKYNAYDFQKMLTLLKFEYPTLVIDEDSYQKISEWHNIITQQKYLEVFFEQEFEEIIFHGAHDVTLIKNGCKEFYKQRNLNFDDFQLSLAIFASKNGQRWNYSDSFSSFGTKLFNSQCRVTLIHESLSPKNQTTLLIRRSFEREIELHHFCNEEDINKNLKDLVLNQENILIAGSTGSGKTSLTKALLKICPKEEHIVILEDTHELHSTHFNHTHLLAVPNDSSKNLKSYCSYALRMSPNRVILGEIRSNEVIPFVMAMNTGHKGMLSTIHANSALDAVYRLTLLFSLYQESSQIKYETILKLICQSLNYVVFVENKKIVEIIKIQNSNESQVYYQQIYQHQILSKVRSII